MYYPVTFTRALLVLVDPKQFSIGVKVRYPWELYSTMGVAVLRTSSCQMSDHCADLAENRCVISIDV